MTEKMLDSTRQGMTRNSSHLASMYGKDFLELVWENGQILVQGGSSNRTPNNPSCIGYSAINPSHKEAIDIKKRTRLSTLCSLLDHFPSRRDSDLSSSNQTNESNDQDSSQIDLQFSQNNKSSNKLKEEFINKRQVKESKLAGGTHQPATTTGNYSHLYSSQQCIPPPAPLKKPRLDSSQTPATNSQKLQYLGCDQRAGKVNFSNFLIPAMFLKSTYHHHQGNSANNASLARLEEIEALKVEKAKVAATSSQAPNHSVVIESAKGSNVLTGFQDQQTSLTANKSNIVSLVARSDKDPPVDEHSEAVGHNNSATLGAKGKDNTNLCNEPLLASSSVCSLGASNDPSFCIRKHEDTDDSTYLSDNDEEPEDVVVKETPAQEGNGVRRSRNAEIHNLSERKRRDKINKKMRILKELIPNCNKMDKASMLDDAIDYLKTLKLQLQIMSMGRGLCTPLMMLPAATHHINAPHLPQLMASGMGFRPGTGIVPYTPPQFPIPALSGITDNTLQMFGFPNQMPPMPMSHTPNFIPMIGNPSTQPLMPTSTATNNLAEHLANSAQLTTLEVSVPKNSDLQMFGFSNQMPHMPIPHAPSFIPTIGNSPTQPFMATSTPTNLTEHLSNSAQPTALEVSVPKNSDPHTKAELCATKQPTNQVSLHHIPSYPFYFPTKIEEKKTMESE